MISLPERWTEARIDQVADLVRGVSYKKEQASEEPATDFLPMLRATNISARLDLETGLIYVPRSVVSQNQLLQLGDIVLAASSGSQAVVGKSAPLLKEWNGTFGAFCAVLRPRSIEPRFLAYRVAAADIRNLWSEAALGTNINNLKREHILGTRIAVPPYDEQRSIVQLIEEHFSRLDNAEASMRRARKNLARLRATIISSSLSGGWLTVELGSIITSLKNGVFVSRPALEPPGIRIFRISAVRPLRLDVDDVRYAPSGTSGVDSYFVETGDLLFTRYSGNPDFVGSCAVVPNLEQPTLHPDKLIRVVVDRTQGVPDFVALAINNGRSRREIEQRLKTTAGQVGISGSQLRTVSLPLPPLDVQHWIVDDVRRKLSMCEAEVNLLDDAFIRSRQLRRAVLERVFSGDLLSYDADRQAVATTVGQAVANSSEPNGQPCRLEDAVGNTLGLRRQ
jgi:type I restriction enzyme S subunit